MKSMYHLWFLLPALVYFLSTTCTRVHAEVCGTEGDIRLVNGSNRFEGRVEYCNGTIWGRVCQIGFLTEEIMVACRQLGFSGNFNPVLESNNSVFGRSMGLLIQRNWSCSGNEEKLIDCESDEASSDMCMDNEDGRIIIGLYCFGNIQKECTENEIRLVNGFDERSGRVEVCLDGRWGTVCDDGWDSNDATTVCRQLGYNTTVLDRGIPTRLAYFGEGNGPIHLSQAQCTSSNMRLTDCPANTSGINGCEHCEDAGVICQGPTNCTDGDVRLMNGTSVREGRVEICYNGVWGTVCDTGWDEMDASVVCNELGWINLTAMALSNVTAGSGPVFLYNVSCDQSHSSLSQCVHPQEIGLHDCASGIAGVSCQDVATTVNTEVMMSVASSPSANTGPQIGIVVGAVVGVLAVVIIAAILVVVILLILRRRVKDDSVTIKGTGQPSSMSNPVGEKETYTTPILRELKNPIYCGGAPGAQSTPTEPTYDGVYSYADVEMNKKPSDKNGDSPMLGCVTNDGGKDAIGINSYATLEPSNDKDQPSIQDRQEQPVYDGIYSEADDTDTRQQNNGNKVPSGKAHFDDSAYYSTIKEKEMEVQPPLAHNTQPLTGSRLNLYDEIGSEAADTTALDQAKCQNKDGNVPSGGTNIEDNFYSALEGRGVEVQPHIYDQQLLPESQNGYSRLQHK